VLGPIPFPTLANGAGAAITSEVLVSFEVKGSFSGGFGTSVSSIVFEHQHFRLQS
jgi:hypothetical protein